MKIRSKVCMCACVCVCVMCVWYVCVSYGYVCLYAYVSMCMCMCICAYVNVNRIQMNYDLLYMHTLCCTHAHMYSKCKYILFGIIAMKSDLTHNFHYKQYKCNMDVEIYY